MNHGGIFRKSFLLLLIVIPALFLEGCSGGGSKSKGKTASTKGRSSKGKGEVASKGKGKGKSKGGKSNKIGRAHV